MWKFQLMVNYNGYANVDQVHGTIEVVYNGTMVNGYSNIKFVLWMVNQLNNYWRLILLRFKYEYHQVKYYFYYLNQFII